MIAHGRSFNSDRSLLNYSDVISSDYYDGDGGGGDDDDNDDDDDDFDSDSFHTLQSEPIHTTTTAKKVSDVKSIDSYLIALGYSEQLSAGVHSVLQLSALAMDFEAHLVEPTVVTSHLFGIEGVYPPFYNRENLENKAAKLFFMFNQTKVNNMLHSRLSSYVDMASFKSFLKSAPREITILHFNSRTMTKSTTHLFAFPEDEVVNVTETFDNYTDKHVISCLEYSGMKNMSAEIERELNLKASAFSSGDFKVTQGLCLNHDHIYRSDYLLSLIPKPRTIIITNWGGCGLKDCTYNNKDEIREKEVMAAVPHIRHSILTTKTLVYKLQKKSALHNGQMHSIAKKYLNYLDYSPQQFIAIHVRLERLVRHSYESTKGGNYKKCRESILKVINKVFHGIDTGSYRQQYRHSRQVLALSDNPGSEYGSDSCFGTKCSLEEVEYLHGILKKALDFQSFDPKFWKVPENGGIVSLVEMHMLSMGKKLILVGYGGFQATLKNLFLSLAGHKETDVYHVCNEE